MPYLYAVRMLIPNQDPQPIKIGYSTTPDRRRLAYNSGPYPCEWLGTWICYSTKDELDFHMRFAHLNLTGEWFKPDAEFLSAITQKIEAHNQMVQASARQAQEVIDYRAEQFKKAGEVLARTATQ